MELGKELVTVMMEVRYVNGQVPDFTIYFKELNLNGFRLCERNSFDLLCISNMYLKMYPAESKIY